MSHHLDPAILEKLQAFARRRRTLIIMRGACAAVAMLLATMMLVALVDWIFVLDDWMRWTLSGVAYLAVLIAEWRACLRLLVHMPDPRRLARLIEHAEPRLREDLLSAVELGQGDAALDSEQFRQLVQTGVAARLEDVDVKRLLPVNLLRRSLSIVTVIVLVCAGALTLTGFEFGTSMIRALLPMLNLARVSKVKVHIVEPNPADETVAQGDAVPLTIELGGQRANRAMLEIFTKSGGRELVQMSPSGQDQFTTSIQVAREDVEYRIRAGDAMTRKYRLTAAARPHIVHFFKTYNYPAYSKLPPKQVTEEGGDLAALEQTSVALELETDQPAKEAELRIEKGKVNSVIPLTPLPNGRLGATVPLDKSGIYRVHLVAAATGFENKFSPEYELRADPDLVPQIEIDEPEHDLILPANEIVDIVGTATDDLAVDHVEQQYRVNGGAWKSIPIQTPGGAKVKVESRWDLMEQGLKAGDTVTTRLVAFDLKQNRGESRPLQITLTAGGFEMKRLQALENQRKLLQALIALRTAGEALDHRGAETRDQFGKLQADDPQRKQVAISLGEALDEYERESASASGLLVEALRETSPGHNTGNLVTLGREISLGAGAAQNVRDILNIVLTNPAAAGASDLTREGADQAAKAGQRARTAQESCRVFVGGEEADVINENLQVVDREQNRISSLAQDSGTDAARWAQLATRLRVVLTETRGLGDLMAKSAEHIQGHEDRLRRTQKKLEEQCAAVDKAMAANATGKDMLKPVTELTKALTEAHRSMLDMRQNTGDASPRALVEMERDLQADWTNLEKLRTDADAAQHMDKLAEDAKAALAEGRWKSRSGLFKAHGDLEEARPDADNYFVSDVRSLSLALDALRPAVTSQPHKGPEWDKTFAKLNALDQAFRVLESGHTLSEIAVGIDHFAAAERWEFAALRARTSNPRDWRWLRHRLQQEPDEIGKTQLTNQETRKVVQDVQHILWDAIGKEGRPLDDEIGQRFRLDREPIAVTEQAQRMAGRVREALDLLRKPMEDARKVLTEMAPTLSQMAAELAKESEDLKKKSNEQKDKVTEKTPEQAQADAKAELAEQQKLNGKVDEFKDALRADAGKQDLLKKEGREQARDVDDALAMLREPPPRAEQALNDAADQERPAAKQDAFKAAATEQQKLADALQQVSKHFDALEKGEKPTDTRTALRDAENALGVKEDLDQQYANAEKLAAMAGLSPEDMLKQLEQALPKNPAMQQELSSIAQQALDTANAKLAQASNQENGVAKDVQKLAGDEAKAAAEKAAQAAQSAQNSQNGDNAQNASAANQAQANQGAQPNQPQPNQGNQTAQNSQNAQAPPGAANPPAGSPPPTPSGATAQNQSGQPQGNQPPQAGQPANPQLAQAAKQQPVIKHNAGEAGDDIQRAGRHEERLQNTATGQRLQQLGTAVQETAQQQVPQAQQALAAAQNAAQAQAPVSKANGDLQTELAQLAKEAGGQEAQAGQEAPAVPPDPNGTETAAQQGQAGQLQKGQPANAMSGQNAKTPKNPENAQNAQNAENPHAGEQANAQANQKANAENGRPGSPEQGSGQQAQASAQAGNHQAAQAANGQTPPAAGAPDAQPPAADGSPAVAEAAPPTADEQTWMARMLDALDAAMHATEASAQAAAAQSGQPQGQQAQGQNGQQPPGQPGQQTSGQAQPGQPGGQEAQANAMAQAQQAMNAAAQANAAAMRSNRSEAQSQQPSGEISKGEQQAASKGGAMANATKANHKGVPELKAEREGDWGRLPKKMAEQLSQGQRENVSPEYRNQIETYYRVIAERAKKE